MPRPRPAKEPMGHVVALAAADSLENPQATRAMHEFGAIKVNDAERDAHQVLRKHGLTAPIAIERADLGENKWVKGFPFIFFSTWVKYLLDSGRLPRQLCSCEDVQSMQIKLSEFWKRYETIYPRHKIFAMRDAGTLDLSLVIPIYSHTDEGRSYKKQAIWLLSSHGALGRGTRGWLKRKKDKVPLKRCGFGLNFCGHTWSTHFMFACMLRKCFKHNPEYLDNLVRIYAEDMERLLCEGVPFGDKVIRCCHIGTKGDLPALCRMGNMNFSFSNVPRRAQSKKPCEGICWMCCAGQERNVSAGLEAIPFEDTSGSPRWEATLGKQKSWNERPPLIHGIPLLESDLWTFYKTDVWHNLHLGLCKHWVASALVSMLENLPLGAISMDDKVQWLGGKYNEFCKRKNCTPHCEELGRETLNWPQQSACPVGAWNKGSASTHFMLFLEDLCSQWATECQADPLLQAIATMF